MWPGWSPRPPSITHWGQVTHICVGKLTIIGSDNGLSPERRQAIIWTNDGILLIGPLGTNFSEILIEIQTFSLKKIRLKMSSAKCCSFRLGLSLLNNVSSKYECIAILSVKRICRQDDRPSHHRRRWRQASAPPVKTRAATSTTFLLLYDHRVA